jgi:hypothetical protein
VLANETREVRLILKSVVVLAVVTTARVKEVKSTK